MTDIGPHLLGRIYRPDPRDWSVAKLHATIEPPDALLDLTVQEAIDTSPFFQTWAGIRALWRWIKKHLHPPAVADTTPAWDDLTVLDQGNFGTCVGNGWAGWGIATPVVDSYSEKDARAIYYEATVFDGTPDNPDAPGGGQAGSTVRSGAKAMQKRGRLIAYGFAGTLSDIDEWIDKHGPVVMGTNWTEDMFSPDANGYVVPSGALAGGHCYLLLDRIDEEDAYLFLNSWGTTWGNNGLFKMRAAAVQNLLDDQGEACCAAEVPA